jgi:hypothetical protein
MITYTTSRPPILSTNLGSTPWPDIDTVKPYINIVDYSGTDLVYNTVNATTYDLEQIVGTPLWVYRLADHDVTLPAVYTEYYYYITRGDGGEIIDEGRFALEDDSTTSDPEAVSSIDVSLRTAIEIPSSVSEIKSYSIKAIAKKADGTAATGVTMTLDITYNNPSNIDVTSQALVEAGGVFEYPWQVDYNFEADLADVKITVTKGGFTTDKIYQVELFKKYEYNPQRISSGIVM